MVDSSKTVDKNNKFNKSEHILYVMAKDTIKFTLSFFVLLFTAVLIYGCSILQETDEYQSDKDPAIVCTKVGQHQAYCLYELALSTADIELCNEIDVDTLSKAEKSPELRANIPAVRDKCYFDVSIKKKDPSDCVFIADSKNQYNGDNCYFEIAQANNDLSICLRVTPAGRINPETKYVYNQANCISKIKAKLISAGCGKGEQRDMRCVVSLGATTNSDACDEYFKTAGNAECKIKVKDLMDKIEKSFMSAWVK